MRPTLFEFIHHGLITETEEDLNLDLALDVEVMPVTHPMISKTTGADSEAWSLANGKPGQVLVIYLAVDGNGIGTLTPDTSTNWLTIVFADAGDQAVLFYVNDTIGWIIISVFGLTEQPTVTV